MNEGFLNFTYIYKNSVNNSYTCKLSFVWCFSLQINKLDKHISSKINIVAKCTTKIVILLILQTK